MNYYLDAETVRLYELFSVDRYLWRDKNTYAIAQHKHHRSIYEEADANKRRKRYARPLIDLHMKIYYYEGMKPWSLKKNTKSGMNGDIVFSNEICKYCIFLSSEVHALAMNC